MSGENSNSRDSFYERALRRLGRKAREALRTPLGCSLVGSALIITALVLLALGSVRIAEDRGPEFGSGLLVMAGLGSVVAGITLLMAAYRLRDPGKGGVPWLTLGSAAVAIGAFIGIAILAVADAFVQRQPSRVVTCPDDAPDPGQSPGPGQSRAVFSFPDEAEQTAGLKVQMGRSRPASARSDQILVLESGDPLEVGDAQSVEEDQDASATSSLLPEAGSDGYLQVALSELRRDDGARLNRQLVSGSARMLNERNMEVAICFVPLSDEFAETDPGRYTGRLTVIDPRVARIEIPVEIQLQFNRWPILAVLLVATLVIAAFTLYNGVRQLSGDTARLDARTFSEFWAWILTNPVAIGTGVVAASALFASQYLADPAWSGRTAEVLALIGATAAAFLGAATVAAGIDPRRARRSQAEHDDSPGPEPDGNGQPAVDTPASE